ncbi:MAG: hypothetical protein RCO49_05610 [Rickettsia endosymbiont of Argas persicus]
MLDIEAKTSLYIKVKYKKIIELCINNEVDDIYHFIPHSLRYNILNYTLKLASLPFTIISGVTEFLTFGTFSLKYFNVGKIFSNKMNQNISKKVLYGLPEENIMVPKNWTTKMIE